MKPLSQSLKPFFEGLPEEYVNDGPEEVVLANRYFFMAKMGQRGSPVLHTVMV